MIDESATVVKLLQEELQTFAVKNAEIYRAKVPQQLKPPSNPFDIVFLDPPYQEDLLLPCCFYLEENNFLAKKAFIYLEAKEHIKESDLPSTWRLIKNKKAGQVFYHLAQRN